MLSCEGCQQQLLSLLYDLLEPTERQEVTAHLNDCAACQAALATAKEHQGLLAEAVKEKHPGIVFKAPVKAAPPSAPTLDVPVPRRPIYLNRWALAACLLIAILSVGAFIGINVKQHQAEQLAAARTRLANAREDLNQAQKLLNGQQVRTHGEIRAIREQIDTLFKSWQEEEAKTRNKLKDEAMLNIEGPEMPRPGVNNSYVAEVRQQQRPANKDNPLPGNFNNNNQKQVKDVAQNQAKQDVQMQANLVNQDTNALLYAQRLNFDGQNRANFTIPSNLQIKPEDKLAWEFLHVEGNKLIPLNEKLNVPFAEFVTHLTTDRPMYRPGETLRFRSLTLERFSLKPAQETFHLRYRLVGPDNAEIAKRDVASELLSGPDKKPVMGPDGQPLRGIGAGEFTLPQNLPAGQYALIVSEVNERFREEKRKFVVHHSQAPRFNIDVQFNCPSYSAGDPVKVNVRVVPTDPLAPSAQRLPMTARLDIDGKSQQQISLVTGNEGLATFDAELPAQIAKGVGTLTLACNDGGTPETVVRSIPINVRNLQVEFFPEGGDLVAGVPNRVYFQVRTPAGKPADLIGRVMTIQDGEIARVQTLADELHQGLGSFTFTPKADRIYKLYVDSPIGIDARFTLPGIKSKGIVLNLPQGVVEKEIPLTIHSPDKARELLIGAYCRGRLLDHAVVKTEPRKPTQVTLKPVGNVGGVYRITVFEKVTPAEEVTFRPLAERLIYRKQTDTVAIDAATDRKSYQPGERVRLSLDTHVPSVALIAVVDNHVRQLADEKTARNMLTHFLLTTELRDPEDLENTDVFLGPHPQAAAALDLLLGCQGWRRFAEQDPQSFVRRQAPGKTPVFLANTAMVPQFLESEQKQIAKVDEQFVVKALALEKNLAEKEKKLADPAAPERAIAVKVDDVARAEDTVQNAEEALQTTNAMLFEAAQGGFHMALLCLGFFFMSVGLRRLAEGLRPNVWFIAGIGLLGLLFLVSVLATFSYMGESTQFGRWSRVMAEKRGRPAIIQAPEAEKKDRQAAANVAIVEEADDDLERQAARAKASPLTKLVIPAEVAVADVQKTDQLDRADRKDERSLRAQGDYQTIIQKHVGRRVQMLGANDPCYVREYAHQHSPRKDAIRADFAETVYWHPALVLQDGKADLQFDLSDSVTRYDVLLLSHTFDGRLGARRLDIVARPSFSIEPSVPSELSNTDQLTMPVTICNGTAAPASLTLSQDRLQGLRALDNTTRGYTLGANESKRTLFQVQPTITQGAASVRYVGKTNLYTDNAISSFQVVPDGVPVTGALSGVCEKSVTHEITLPKSWIPGSLQVQAQFYPSPLAQLQGGLDALAREPIGGFEQNSSSNFASASILNHLKQAKQMNPLVEKNARDLLDSGYARLTSFECTDPAKPGAKRGFEWFGQTAPPDAALTASALLQLREIARLHPVDTALVQRTEKYLLDLRDHAGGFKHPKGADPITDAYVVWALTEAGTRENLTKELAALRGRCQDRKDPYLLSLTALSHLNLKKTREGIDLLKTVGNFQDKDGRVAGAQSSISGSQGRDLDVETTALALLGWIQANRPAEFAPNQKNAVQWLNQQRRGDGSFGAGKATTLALKALLAVAQKNPRPLENGDVQMVFIPAPGTGNPIVPAIVRPAPPALAAPQIGLPPEVVPGQQAMVTPRSQEIITLALHDTSALLPGTNAIQLTVGGNNAIPYTLTWSYRAVAPVNDPKAPVRLAAKLNRDQAREGDTVKLTATIENVSGKAQGMTVAVLGLPAGVALPENAQQLKDYVSRKDRGAEAGKISAWELRGRELVLSWRQLPPNAKIDISLNLTCRFPGHYRGPASRAYLSDDTDSKFWIAPLGIGILPIE